MSYEIRKWIRWSEDLTAKDGSVVRRVLVAAVIRNPLAGLDTDSIDEIADPSEPLGVAFGEKLQELLGSFEPKAYGKGALVGRLGEFEHGKAFLTTRMVDPIRKAMNEAKSWVPSTCKRAMPGAVLDLPLGGKDDLWNDELRQTISLSFPDAPLADEVVVIFGVSSGVV
jgi:hypothetical protein